SKSRDSQSKVVDRFRTEAKAAAQLQHENIVPVYDVGEVGDKLYFSMQLVEGESLSDMVDAGPLEPRRAAAYLRGVAQGIQAAHDRGILHRDLKPHNVMIDRRNDRPLVADFGLAKVVEADDQLTRSGEVIGTPSYMAPEQVSSAAGVDAAADLYALGATLYHLLTGRPPFKGPNTMATLRQVLFQEVVEPRQLNAAIDRDLNTICVKCLQKDASRRYRSAAELADDLGRYLEGRPIAARPVGPTERAARWCRRNPLAASMLGLAGVMAGLVFASVLVGYRQTTAALAVAEHNYELARDSVDTLYTDVSQIDLENAPGMQPLKQKLLRRSLGYYQRLLDGPAGDGRAGDAELTTELAGNHFRVGSILADLGEAANAVGHLQTAADIQSDLLADRPDDAELRLARSDSLNKLARAQLRRGDAEAARASFGEAKEIRSRLVEQRPRDRELRRKLASVEMNLGLLAARGGDYVSARESYDAAQAVRLELLKEEETPDVARDLAKGSFNLGVLHGREGRFAEAAAALRQAIARYESLLAAEPESLAHRFSLGVAQFL
ncbi:MAG: protein kinase, partial [Planctomycetota bacterium]